MPQLYRFTTLCLLFAIFSIAPLKATHNRAGEITVRQIGDCNSLTVEATIITYTKESSRSADRDTLTICWGDGKCEKVARSNGFGQVLSNDTKLNYYISTHTYSGRGRYKISMSDPNRIDNIININGGRSVQVPFYIETVYTFLNPQFQGCNSTPRLLQPPIDVGCVGKEFRHYPNPIDADKDSLAFRLIVPLQTEGKEVPNYKFPSEIIPGAGNLMFLNEVTGEFIWSAPQRTGDYNIAILIISYRNGAPIDSMIRDMQIRIEECSNLPPEIVTESELCVVAGTLIEVPVTATAPLSETTQKVNLQAYGGPFEVLDSAEFIVAGGYQNQPLHGLFRWQTTCNHISDQYYSVVFRASDNFPVIISNLNRRDTLFLSTLHILRIKVVGPAPEDLQAETAPGQVELSWESPYVCENASEDYFFGFSIYRRIGANPFQRDTCQPGLDGRGYTRIQFRTRDLKNGRYFFVDSDVERGRTYCYRVVAVFAKRTSTGQPFNLVESLASEEVCIQLNRDLPLITNVDVQETDAANGRIEVRWSKPNGPDLDTLENPGSYRYQVLRATGIAGGTFVEIPSASFTSATFANANDTVWVDDTGLNTAQNPYAYKVAFYVNNEALPLGDTENASSVFLRIFPTDNQNDLSWEFNTPWENVRYVIYRDDDGDAVFDSIGITAEISFSDTGLVNGNSYCYYVKSIGSYGIAGIIEPIENRSQRACGVPVDNVPPCPTVLLVSNICDENTEPLPGEILENALHWRHPESLCREADDVAGYRVYFTSDSAQNVQLIAEINFASDTFFIHQPERGLAGCYAVSSFDVLGNESPLSEKVCVDNCPLYRLPNAFTPNGDSQNDLFKPYPYRFIDRVEFRVFNRWGSLVFETNDPALNWTGEDSNGKELSDGTYFFTCKVFENRVTGVMQQQDLLSGYIELLRVK